MTFDLKHIVKDNTVRFVRYRKGVAYYAVRFDRADAEFVFPVALDDVGDATLEAEDRAMLFMRYIRRALDEGTFVRLDPNGESSTTTG